MMPNYCDQGILQETNGNMPVFLQDKCMLSMMGYCAPDLSSDDQLVKVGKIDGSHFNSTHGNTHPWSGEDMLGDHCGQSSCRCHKLHGLLEQYRLASVENGHWIRLIYGSSEYLGEKIEWIPELHHIHWNSLTIANFDLHVCKSFISLLHTQIFSHFDSSCC